MDCQPLRLADWNNWKDFNPVDPLALISNCSIGSDTGVYLNSSTFAAPTPSLIPTPEIVGASVSTNIAVPVTTLANMPVDIITLTVNAGQNPNIIDVTFSAPVDQPSVTTTSFSVTLLGVPVAGAISFPTIQTARFTATAPLTTGNLYTVILKGTGSTPITFFFGAIILDGEPTQLPSGNGTPGGDFTFHIHVVASGAPQVYPPANIFGWNPTLFSLGNLPTCSALGSDNFMNVANANQWNFRHKTANLDVTLAQPLREIMYFRAGKDWNMTVPINLGSLSYPDIQLSFRNDAGTRGDCQGTIPVISFTARNYTGLVNLGLTLRVTGSFIMGLRAIDSRGNYFMYESNWQVVP